MFNSSVCYMHCTYIIQVSLARHQFYVDADEEQSWINEKVQLLATIDSLPTDLSSALLMSTKLQVHYKICSTMDSGKL